MEWTETLKRTVDYLEEHLLEDGAAERAAQAGLTVPEEKTEPVWEYPQYPMSSTRKPITAPER